MESHELTQRFTARLAETTGEPAAHRIVETIWLAVVDGTLDTGERLPTARQIAIALNVSPRVVQRAYEQLEDRGVIATRPGEGTFVSLVLPSEEDRRRHREFTALCRDAVARAQELGFGVNELLETMADFRDVETHR